LIRWGTKNVFTHTPISNSPTPGNLTLSPTTNGVDVIWYDIGGGPHWMTTFSNAPPPAP
jgi:hypothetical protein